MKVQRKFKMQAHISSRVVMDVAAFKVSHSEGTDIDATALRAHARARSSSTHRGDGTLHMGSIRGKAHILPDNAHATVSISAGQWNVTCLGSIRRKTHAALPRYTANSKHTMGAMEESSGRI